MLLTVTNAGLQAIANAGNPGGPKVNITSFKVGSAVGYTPLVTDTNLRGTTLYTGAPNNYQVLSNNNVVYTCFMDTSVGTFNFGELGLFLQDGTLFALGSLSAPQLKTAGGTGNIISIDAVLQLTNIAPSITYNFPSTATARLLYVPSVTNLASPLLADSNAYITGTFDDGANIVYAIRKGTLNQWTFPSHQVTMVGNGQVSTGNVNGLTSNNIGNILGTNPPLGRYLVHFITGQLTGLTRAVNASALNSIGWADPLGQAPAAGDRFDVYQSNYSALAAIAGVADDALINAIVLGGD